MSFVNKKIGNGFLMNAVDSSKDNEHYFGGHKKTINVCLRGYATGLSESLSKDGSNLYVIAKNFNGDLFAAGSNRSLPYQYLLFSSDEGKAWTQITPSGLGSAGINDLFVDNQDVIWAGQRRGANTCFAIYSSSDNGNKFISSLATGSSVANVDGCRNIIKTPNGKLFACGGIGEWVSPPSDYSSHNYALIMTSSDNGINWGSVVRFSCSADNSGEFILYSMDYYDDNNIVAVGQINSGTMSAEADIGIALFKTTTGGATGSWTYDAIYTGSFYGGYDSYACGQSVAVNKTTGEIFIAGYAGLVEPVIYKTHITASIGEYQEIFRLSLKDFTYAGGRFLNIKYDPKDYTSSSLFVCGYANAGQAASIGTDSRPGIIMKSIDGGNTWNYIYNNPFFRSGDNPPRVSYWDFELNKDGNMVIVGDRQIAYNTSSIYVSYPASEFILSSSNATGATGVRVVRDTEGIFEYDFGAQLNTASLYGNFNVIPGTNASINNSQISFFIKSDTSLNLDVETLAAYFKDDTVGSFWQNYINLKNYGSFIRQNDGWTKFVSNFGNNMPKLDFKNNQFKFRFSGSNDSIRIKDVRLDFGLSLTDGGIEYFKQIDNQFINNNAYYMNTNALPARGQALNNISEFPHAGGIFQMPNIVLGTKESGKIGTSDDNIVQVKHIGSTVKILWPQQNENIDIKGYGDFSAGQTAGKLSTTFVQGDYFNVSDEGYDHMSLYCYLRKELSGTLDDVELIVERRPLRDVGFTTDQGVAYVTSGSFVEARYRDIRHKHQIDYGDLSLREIGWPIDIPLANTKDIRISARHVNGQAEQNKNLIIYGRFVKGDKNTNEV